MNSAFYTGVTGLVAFQKDLDITANNLANVNTAGYKSVKSDFDDLLYSKMNTNGENEHFSGSGVKQTSAQLIFKQGDPAQTGVDLDFAMVGDGFFAIDRGGKKPEYTRNGAFTISDDDGDRYLVTSDGGYVLDSSGSKIEIPEEKVKSSSSSSKSKAVPTIDYKELMNQIGIYKFGNPYDLQPVGSSSFVPTETSGKITSSSLEESETGLPEILRGYLESSSVDLSKEMVNMIQTQRAFQFSSKIVKTADEIEEVINNLR